MASSSIKDIQKLSQATRDRAEELFFKKEGEKATQKGGGFDLGQLLVDS